MNAKSRPYIPIVLLHVVLSFEPNWYTKRPKIEEVSQTLLFCDESEFSSVIFFFSGGKHKVKQIPDRYREANGIHDFTRFNPFIQLGDNYS